MIIQGLKSDFHSNWWPLWIEHYLDSKSLFTVRFWTPGFTQLLPFSAPNFLALTLFFRGLSMSIVGCLIHITWIGLLDFGLLELLFTFLVFLCGCATGLGCCFCWLALLFEHYTDWMWTDSLVHFGHNLHLMYCFIFFIWDCPEATACLVWLAFGSGFACCKVTCTWMGWGP